MEIRLKEFKILLNILSEKADKIASEETREIEFKALLNIVTEKGDKILEDLSILKTFHQDSGKFSDH